MIHLTIQEKPNGEPPANKPVGFADLGISGGLPEKLLEQGIADPTPVQEKAMPFISGGRDVICGAPTGTGKTLAYLLPILSKIDLAQPAVQAIVLAPSKELAVQIHRVARSLTDEPKNVMAILGGTALNRQLEGLKDKPRLIVGTPGRVQELIGMGRLKVHYVKSIVVDEADKMFKSGFGGDVTAIVRSTLRDRQLVFVSATVTEELEAAASRLMKDPVRVELTGRSKTPETVDHYFLVVRERDKLLTVKRLLDAYKPPKAALFIDRNEGVPSLVQRFRELGIRAEGLHGDLPEQARRNAMVSFREGKAELLVTTDLFSRGLDVKGLDLIINYDLPERENHYIHRSGRTGRAGRKGLSVSVVTEDQKAVMWMLQKRLKVRFTEVMWGRDGLIPVRPAKPEKPAIRRNAGKKLAGKVTPKA